MRADCPVCTTTLEAAVTHCPGCGYPTALSEGLGTTRVELPPDTLAGTVAHARDVATPPVAASPASALAEQTAREIGRKIELAARLGAETGSLAGSLCEAMAHESAGETDRAVTILRSADQTADETVRGTLKARVARLKQRRAKLSEAGVDLPSDAELDRLEGPLVAEDPGRAAELLQGLEERLSTTEGQWHGLEQVFEEIAALRALASRLGVSVEEVPSRVEEAKRLLTSGPVRPEQVSQAAREITDELDRLGRALSPAADAELGRLGEMLKTSPDDPTERNRARAIRGRAARDLASNRVVDVLRAVVELRELLAVGAPVSPEPAAAPSAPAAPGSGEPLSGEGTSSPPSEVSVDSLLAKARGFAVKVRSLPPNSEAGRAAAAQIKEAAELLRQGRLVEADQALTRLMRTLASPGGTS